MSLSSVTPARKLGDYTVSKLVYKGVQSVVFSAVSGSGQLCCIKASHKLESKDPDLLQKISREVKLSRELRNPYIIRGLETWEDEKFVYLAQEYAAAGDLAEVVGLYPLKCVPEALASQKIMKPLLLALSFLHSRGIIHRDLKPENCVMTDDGTVKICDFGVAIDSTVDVPVSRVGTIEFMAPEIVRLEPHRSEEELDALRRAGRPLYGTAVDIWSLGCVAVEVLFGVPLFSARSGAHGPDCELDAELEAKIADEAPVRLLERTRARRRLSPAAVEFVEAMLARADTLRPSADDLLLHPWISGEAGASDLLSTSPLPSSSPLAAFAQALSGRRGASAASLSTHDSAESETFSRARMGGSEQTLGDRPGVGTLEVPSSGGRLSAPARWQTDTAESLVWPPRPSPTSTLLFPTPTDEDPYAEGAGQPPPSPPAAAGCGDSGPPVPAAEPTSPSARRRFMSSAQPPPQSPRPGVRCVVGSPPDRRSSGGAHVGSPHAEREGRSGVTWFVIQDKGGGGHSGVRPAKAHLDTSWHAGTAYSAYSATQGGLLGLLTPRLPSQLLPPGRRRAQSLPARADANDNEGSWHGGVLRAAGIDLTGPSSGAGGKLSPGSSLPRNIPKRNSVAPLPSDCGNGAGSTAQEDSHSPTSRSGGWPTETCPRASGPHLVGTGGSPTSPESQGGRSGRHLARASQESHASGPSLAQASTSVPSGGRGFFGKLMNAFSRR